jgi:ribosome-binding ATPase
LRKELNNGKPAREVALSQEEQMEVKGLFLLTSKPEIVVFNVSEEDYTKEKIGEIQKKYSEMLGLDSSKTVVICAKIESELAGLSEEDQMQYLLELGLDQSGLERLIKKAYETLGLISFLTAGEKEVRAWTIKKGSSAVEAAGEIHTDFMKKFIKAEVVNFAEFAQSEGWKGSREKGKARLEGKDYIINDGDVVEFKIGS